MRRHLSREGQRYGSRLSAAASERCKAQVCVYTHEGLDLHWPGQDDDNGRWTIALPNDFRCVVKGSSRVVDPGGNRVTDVCGFNASTTSDLDLGDMVLTEGTHEWTKDDLTLTHADGVTLFSTTKMHSTTSMHIEVLDLTVRNCLATVTVQIIGLPSP